MILFSRTQKLIVFVVLLILATNSFGVKASFNVDYGEVVEISELIQDPNGIGIVLDNDISSYLTNNSFIYIFVGLSQDNELNGLYIAGFRSYNDSMLIYKLGTPTDTSNQWFNSSSGLILNYGSIIYLDILDYLVAFGNPSEVDFLVLLTPLDFTQMKQQAENIVSDLKDSFITVSAMTTTNQESSKQWWESMPGFELPFFIGIFIILTLIRKRMS